MSRLFILTLNEAAELPLAPSDYEAVDAVSSPKRQREITAWRALLREGLRKMELTKEALSTIAYNEVGAPYIVDSKLHISVSHCATAAAVLIAEEPCGVDIERCDRNFERVAARYVTEAEIGVLSDLPRDKSLALIWSAKEALYKAKGATDVDFIRDVEIVATNGETIEARILNSRHNLKYIIDNEYVIAYTTGGN